MFNAHRGCQREEEEEEEDQSPNEAGVNKVHVKKTSFTRVLVGLC